MKIMTKILNHIYYTCIPILLYSLGMLALMTSCAYAANQKDPVSELALNGYGLMPDLHYAILDDDKLYSDVSALLAMTPRQFLDVNNNVEGKFLNVYYKWVGVDAIDPNSRGPNVDARALAIVEKIIDRPFVQKGAGGLTNPLFWAAQDLNDAFHISYNANFAHFFAQGPGAHFFEGNLKYNSRSGEIDGITGLNHAAIYDAKLMAGELRSPKDKKSLWQRIFTLIDYNQSLSSFSIEDRRILSEAIAASDLEWNALFSSIKAVPPGDMKGSFYAEKSLGMELNDDFLSMFKEARQRDKNSKQVVLNSLANAYIQKCCSNGETAVRFLKDLGFYFPDLPQPDPEPEALEKLLSQDGAYNAAYTSPWHQFRRMLYLPYDFYSVTLFVRGGKIEWAGAYTQRERLGR